jgi:hypothetical protein
MRKSQVCAYRFNFITCRESWKIEVKLMKFLLTSAVSIFKKYIRTQANLHNLLVYPPTICTYSCMIQ